MHIANQIYSCDVNTNFLAILKKDKPFNGVLSPFPVSIENTSRQEKNALFKSVQGLCNFYIYAFGRHLPNALFMVYILSVHVLPGIKCIHYLTPEVNGKFAVCTLSE